MFLIVLLVGKPSFAEGFLESVFTSTIQEYEDESGGKSIDVPLPFQGYRGHLYTWVDGNFYAPRNDNIPISSVGKEALVETVWMPKENDPLRGDTYLSEVEKSPYFLGDTWDEVKSNPNYLRLYPWTVKQRFEIDRPGYTYIGVNSDEPMKFWYTIGWDMGVEGYPIEGAWIGPSGVVPEPASFLLFGLGGLTLGIFRMLKKRKSKATL